MNVNITSSLWADVKTYPNQTLMSDALNFIRIVLVEPAGALNVGSVARVMKNMGLHQLVLVNPQCDPVGVEARRMAVHAAEILASAQCVMTLPEALQGCRKAIATTGSDTALDIPIESPRVALPWLLESREGDRALSALIFGREDSGLTRTELNNAQRCVRIPSSDIYPSLNLAQSVAICCYELFCSATSSIRSAPHPTLPAAPSPASSSTAASLDSLEGFYQHLETLLLQIGYLYPHTAASRMEKFRRLFNRAYPSEMEVGMLRGILSQMAWALQDVVKSRNELE